MPTLKKLRSIAFQIQHGRCCYCNMPMWVVSPAELPLPPRLAALFRCTAEHLVARQDRGRDEPNNIAAACLLCNRRRHGRKRALQPDDYRALVTRRLAQGRWLPVKGLAVMQDGNQTASSPSRS